MKKKLLFITSFLILVTGLYSPSVQAQQTDDQIFYIEDSGVGSVKHLKKYDMEIDSSINIINNSVSYRNGYYIPSEDSMLLINNKTIYKSDRAFTTFREAYTLNNSDNDIYTDIDLDGNSLYATTSKQVQRLDLASGDIYTEIQKTDTGYMLNVDYSESGKIFYAEQNGSTDQQLVVKDGENDPDTLHTIDIYTKYEHIESDAAGENVYFVLDGSYDIQLMKHDLLNDTTIELYNSSVNINQITLDEANDRILMRTNEDRNSIFELDLSDENAEPVAIVTEDVRVSGFILDSVNDALIYNGGEHDLATNTFTSLTYPSFFEHVLAMDAQQEWLYLVTRGVESRILRTSFTGDDVQFIKPFNVSGTSFRKMRLDQTNNDLYLIDSRSLYKINLDDELPEERLLSLDYGNSIVDFDINYEDNLIYYYLEEDGIYQSDMDGNNYTPVTTDGYYYTRGIAYNPDLNKIYFSRSTWIDQVNTDGSQVEHHHDGFNGVITHIQYDSDLEQMVYIDENSWGTDYVRYRKTNETGGTNLSGIYFSAPSISAIQFMISPSDDIGTSNEELITGIPQATQLSQNYPNPFNPVTVIKYEIARQADVSLDIFDMAGRKVRTLVNQTLTPGTYEATFDASNLASGMYLYRLSVGSNVMTKKLTLIK